MDNWCSTGQRRVKEDLIDQIFHSDAWMHHQFSCVKRRAFLKPGARNTQRSDLRISLQRIALDPINSQERMDRGSLEPNISFKPPVKSLPASVCSAVSNTYVAS